QLARCCLAVQPDGRLRDAAEVARAVEVYLAGVEERVRKAEVERGAAQARAEEAGARIEAERQRADEAEKREATERRARRLVLGLAASVLLLVILGGSGTWLWQTHRVEVTRQRQQTDQEARLAMVSARDLLQKGW